MISDDETLDELRGYGLRVIQPRDGYRFSLDPILLCAFAMPKEGDTVIDLGTGAGIIPMLIARLRRGTRVVGIEMQDELATVAQRNILLNELLECIEILRADILSLRERFPVSSFDLVVANPPYRKAGAGRISPKSGRDKARHETTATIADFLETAKYLVKPSGRIAFTFLPERLAEFCTAATALKLTLLRMRMVHGKETAGARMVLLELMKGRRGDLEVLPPLFVYKADGTYSAEIKRILGLE